MYTKQTLKETTPILKLLLYTKVVSAWFKNLIKGVDKL